MTWFSTLKTSKLWTLKLFGNGGKSREEKGFGIKGANFHCLVTKLERKKRRNEVIVFLLGPHFCVCPKWKEKEGKAELTMGWIF